MDGWKILAKPLVHHLFPKSIGISRSSRAFGLWYQLKIIGIVVQRYPGPGNIIHVYESQRIHP